MIDAAERALAYLLWIFPKIDDIKLDSTVQILAKYSSCQPKCVGERHI